MTSMADVLEGRARWALIHGDNRDVLPMLGDKSVAHVITDPPYGEHVHSKRRITPKRGAHHPDRRSCGPLAANLGFDSLDARTCRRCSAEFARLVCRWVLVFADPEGVAGWGKDLATAGLERVRIGAWIKLGGQPQLTGDRPAAGFEAIQIAHHAGRKRWNGGGHAAVWAHAISKVHNLAEDRNHTTQKPLPLMLELVELFTDPDDVVLDPFAGSGTTGVACLRLGRRFIGIEKDAGFAQVATERLQAESQGLTLRAARAGQLALFAGAAP